MLQVFPETLYALAHDAIAQADKSKVDSQLVGFFLDGLYHDFLHLKVIRKTQNHLRQLFNLLQQNKI